MQWVEKGRGFQPLMSGGWGDPGGGLLELVTQLVLPPRLQWAGVPSFPESLSFLICEMGAPHSPWGCSERPVSWVLSWGWVLWRPLHLTLG